MYNTVECFNTKSADSYALRDCTSGSVQIIGRQLAAFAQFIERVRPKA
jgi:hypothetical protein